MSCLKMKMVIYVIHQLVIQLFMNIMHIPIKLDQELVKCLFCHHSKEKDYVLNY